MSKTTFKKILIVRFSSIGDIVLCSPVVRCLKQQTGPEVHFITKQKFAGVVAASPYIDKVISIESKVSEVKELLIAEQYDLIVDLHKNIRSQQVRSIVKAKYLTFDKINLQKWLAVHTPLDILPKMHLVDRYMAALGKVGISYDGLGLDHFVSQKSIKKAKNLTGASYMVLSLGATYKTKRLPLHRLISVAKSINSPIVLIGGQDVNDLSTQLVREVDRPILNLVGKVSLEVSSAIVSMASYVISGDSGMMHIAAAHRRPLIVPWGSTHPSLGMYPYYPEKSNIPYIPLVLNLACQPCSKIGKDICPKGHFKCMKGLSDELIKGAVLRMENNISSHSL